MTIKWSKKLVLEHLQELRSPFEKPKTTPLTVIKSIRNRIRPPVVR